MKEIRVVGAVIIKDNKILCAKRREDKKMGGFWEFPGGKIEEGESPEEALKREIIEELRCEIEIEKFFTNTVCKYEFFKVNLSTYICRLKDKEPENTEHEELRWLSKNEIKSLNWLEADISTVDELIKIL